MSFPISPIHIVFFKSMSDEKLDLVIEKYCDEFHPSVRQFCISMAKLLRESGTARSTNTNPWITIDCIDDSNLDN